MLREDNNGFVHFPYGSKMIEKIEGVKTFIYIVAFDTDDVSGKKYILSNLRLLNPGTFVNDDINFKQRGRVSMNIDDLITSKIKEDEYENIYFPNSLDKDKVQKMMSIPMTTCICVGWCDDSFEIKDNIGSWSASFRDLTNEGRKLYYSIKKLHNNKEVRILTFSNI